VELDFNRLFPKFPFIEGVAGRSPDGVVFENLDLKFSSYFKMSEINSDVTFALNSKIDFKWVL